MTRSIVQAQPLTRDGSVLGFECGFCHAVVVADSPDGVCEHGHAYSFDYQRTAVYAVCERDT